MLASLGPGCVVFAEPEAQRVPVAVHGEAVIYDADDRVEVFAEPDTRLRDAASASTAAVVLRADIRVDAQRGAVVLDAPSAQEAFDLCADEPFAAQPSAALCTAVLVAPDVVLTAGHCVQWMSCARLALVFGFEQRAPGQLRPLRAQDVYECAEVLSVEVTPNGQAPARDYAFLRLSQKVEAPYHPLEFAPPIEIAAGMQLVTIGHGAGLPLKIARNGAVADARAESGDYYLAAIDNFVGGSGSGVFDAQARLVGLATAGALDFEPSEQGCMRARRESGSAAASERVAYLAPLLQALCDESAAAPELCGRPPSAAQCALTGTGGGGRGARGGVPFGSALLGAAAMLIRLRANMRRRRAARG